MEGQTQVRMDVGDWRCGMVEVRTSSRTKYEKGIGKDSETSSPLTIKSYAHTYHPSASSKVSAQQLQGQTAANLHFSHHMPLSPHKPRRIRLPS